MSEGLAGVVAASTRLSHVDGEAGRLTIAGYAVEDLAPSAPFEEVVCLLLHGRLPDSSERDRFAADLAARRPLSRALVELLREAAAARVPPMDALRMAVPVLSLGRDEDPIDDAMTAIASFPTIIGTYWRLRHGAEPVPVASDLPHAAHYLHQLSGARPSAERARALETYLNAVCDHGFNASTFAARSSSPPAPTSSRQSPAPPARSKVRCTAALRGRRSTWCSRLDRRSEPTR
jgi:citrate synthase